MNQRRNGFTLIELIVVIMVLGILTSITVVAFNGVQQRTRDTARLAELTQVDKMLESYKAMNRRYPLTTADMVPNNLYCVGTGFPGGRCWPLNQMGIPGGDESDRRVTDRLLTIGNLPNGHLLVDGVGTHIWIIDSTSFELNGSFEGDTCPQNFSMQEGYGGHTQCIKIYRTN